MLTDAFLTVSAIYLIVAGYILIRSGLMSLAAPIYRQLVLDIEDLLAMPGLSEQDRFGLRFFRGTMFNGWTLWALVLLVPFFVLPVAFLSTKPTNPPIIQNRINGVNGRWVLGLAAQNPVAGILLILELLIFIAPIEALKRGATSRLVEFGLSRAPVLKHAI